MTISDVGNYLGLTIETVSRNLAKLKKERIISEVGNKNFFLNDKNKIIDLISGAKKAGADYVKFQMRNVETFYPQKILNSEYKILIISKEKISIISYDLCE